MKVLLQYIYYIKLLDNILSYPDLCLVYFFWSPRQILDCPKLHPKELPYLLYNSLRISYLSCKSLNHFFEVNIL